MSNRQHYQTLVDNYKKSAQFVKKLGLAGGMMQFATIIVINSWKHLEMPYYNLAGPILLSWAIYSFMKDFLIFLRVEKDVSQMIVDGIALEKRDAGSRGFFHEVLDDFNLLKILSIRSMINLVAFGCFGYFLSQFLTDLNPDFAINHGLLALISGALTALACKSYHDSLKSLAETKERVFAAKS